MIDLFLEWWAWTIVLVLTLLTLISSVAKYRLGKSGLPTVKERFPRVSDERWERLDRYFQRWGAAFVFFSFLPILALVVPAAAGAYGIRFGPFIFFAFLAKVVRYWILIIILFIAYQIITS